MDAMQIKGFISAVARNGAYGNADVTRRAGVIRRECAYAFSVYSFPQSSASGATRRGEKKEKS